MDRGFEGGRGQRTREGEGGREARRRVDRLAVSRRERGGARGARAPSERRAREASTGVPRTDVAKETADMSREPTRWVRGVLWRLLKANQPRHSVGGRRAGGKWVGRTRAEVPDRICESPRIAKIRSRLFALSIRGAPSAQARALGRWGRAARWVRSRSSTLCSGLRSRRHESWPAGTSSARRSSRAGGSRRRRACRAFGGVRGAAGPPKEAPDGEAGASGRVDGGLISTVKEHVGLGNYDLVRTSRFFGVGAHPARPVLQQVRRPSPSVPREMRA